MEHLPHDLPSLVDRYHKNTLTAAQAASLEAWMAVHEDNRHYVTVRTEPALISALAIVYLDELRRKRDGRRKENRHK